MSTDDLVVGTVTITGADADQFSIQNDYVSGQTLSPGDSATFEVVFSPTSTEAKSATLNIPSNDPDEGENPLIVASSGEGVTVTPVGGTAYPINKLAILVPWIVLGAAIIAGVSLLALRRRQTQS